MLQLNSLYHTPHQKSPYLLLSSIWSSLLTHSSFSAFLFSSLYFVLRVQGYVLFVLFTPSTYKLNQMLMSLFHLVQYPQQRWASRYTSIVQDKMYFGFYLYIPCVCSDNLVCVLSLINNAVWFHLYMFTSICVV